MYVYLSWGTHCGQLCHALIFPHFAAVGLLDVDVTGGGGAARHALIVRVGVGLALLAEQLPLLVLLLLLAPTPHQHCNTHDVTSSAASQHIATLRNDVISTVAQRTDISRTTRSLNNTFTPTLYTHYVINTIELFKLSGGV